MTTMDLPTDALAKLPTASTIPMRTEHPWEEGDVVQVDGKRWIIRVIYRDGSDEVVLVLANGEAHGGRWKTTLDKLPRKALR